MAKKPTCEELAQKVKELEEELVRDSKHIYAHVWSTYSQSPVPTLVLSKEGKIVDYNDAMAHLTGYTHEEVPDVNVWMPKIYPVQEYRDQVIEISERSRHRKVDVKRDEFIITTKSGERRYIVFSVFDILHEGKPTDLQIVQAEDITEQKLIQETVKRAHDELEQRVKERTIELKKLNKLLIKEIEKRKQNEVALRKSEEKFRAIFEHMEAASCLDEIVYDGGKAVDYRILDVNPSYEKLIGIKKEEVIGSLASQVYGTGEAPFLDIYSKVAETGQPASFEAYFAPIDKYLQVTSSCPGKGKFSNVFSDVTERKRAEEAIKESEDKFKYVFDHSAIGKSITFPSGEMKANKALYEMLGYSKEEFPDFKWQQITHPDDVELSQQVVDSLLSGENDSERFIKRYIHKDGSAVWTDVSAALRRDKKGHPLYLMVSISNITEQKKAEEALHRSEERYRALFDHMNDGVAIYRAENDGEDFVFIDFNKSSERIDNIRKEDLIGESALKIFPSVKDFGLFDVFKRVWKTGKPEKYPIAFYEDERISGWRDNFVYKLPSGEIVAIYDDVTERKQAEQGLLESEAKYRHLYETMTQGVVIQDADGKIIETNQAACEILGLTMDQMLGKTAYDPRWRLIHEDGSPYDPAEMPSNIALKTGKPSKGVHCGIYVPEKDEYRWILISSVPRLKDGGTDFFVTMTVFTDITEHKRLEEELLRAQKLESMGVLAGGIAHDFNNILTTILGNVSMAKTQVKPENEIFELLKEAETASIRAQTLTKQLLTFAKGGAPLKETASIKDILKESCSFVLRGSKVRSEFSIPEDLWPAEFDVGQISQVINNIVINANQAMPEGGIIRVAAENLILDSGHGLPLNPGKYIRISIKDQGVGILEKHLLNIFDPYFTTKQEGSGLGLATTYSIIKKHSGYITVESKLGEGTTFHIYLPASEKALQERKEDKVIKGQGRILVMDDEASIRKLAGKMLERLGYEPEFASDGAEAVDIYKAAKESGKPYDVVILDLTIPGGMGGKEALKRLREIDPEVKSHCLQRLF